MRISSCLCLLIAMVSAAGPAYAADGAIAAVNPLLAATRIDNDMLRKEIAAVIDPPQEGEGISRDQATLIAQRYFLVHVGCGAFSGLSELGDSWQVNGSFGYTGAPIKGFLINKKTGALTLPEFWVQ